VATIPTQYGEKIALRLIPKNFKIYDLKYLGFESDMVQKISQDLQKTSGIIIVVGSSGSGKTTSLYAMLRKIDILRRNVITVEDPVEHPLPFVDQVQVNTRRDYTFDNMLKHIARQDPDVIVVGEILDEDTAKLAIRNSATGHLILSTLSSSSVITAISRLKDLGVNKYLLAEGLVGIVSQSLLRRLCNECKKEVEISKDELIEYFTESKTSILSLPHEKIKVFKPVGCKHCMNSGYVGRICIAEFLQIDDEIRDMIEHDKNTIDIKDYIYSNGYNNIKSDALKKVLEGISSLEEVQRVTH
jgi:type IV pilus assembly protein PilB